MDETMKPIKNHPEISAYAEKHEIFDLMQAMLSSLIVDKPDDPISYMISFLKRDRVEPGIIPNHTDVYHKTLFWPADPVVAQRLEMDAQPSEDQPWSLLLRRYSREKAGLRLAYRHIQKRILLVGPPGSGRSLQARRLADKHRLVDHSVVMQVLVQRMSAPDCTSRGWVLHGFPRDLEQARRLHEVFFLEMTEEVSMARLSLRTVDPISGKRYHALECPAPSLKLSLNIHTEESSTDRSKPLSNQERWLLKKQRAGKRKVTSQGSETTSSSKAPVSPSETTPTQSVHQEAPPTKSTSGFRSEGEGFHQRLLQQPGPPPSPGGDAGQSSGRVNHDQTGSGKTLSYGIPIVQSLQAVLPKIKRADGPLALILVPTRELAQQSFQIFQKLVKGINILVSTPGRLVDHINHTLNMVFSSVQWLVLDEADRILDMGFEKDLTIILNSLNSTGPSRQNVLLSATLTQDLTRLADVCLKDPVSVQVSEPASSEVTTSTGPAAGQSESFSVPEALTQHMVLVPSKLRLVCLASFIMDKCKFSQGNKMIVFMASCEAVEFLLTLFKSVLCGASTKHTPLTFLRLHGNMKQEERTEVYGEFSASKSGVLLCTDVAARGLDLPQVTWIVQYNPPVSAAEYVHRVGRTARIGAKGNSLLFLTPSESGYITELANHKISLSEMKLYDILSTLMQDDAYKGRGKYHSRSGDEAEDEEEGSVSADLRVLLWAGRDQLPEH
ncbi:hypothetical protein NHX12_029086 [Muraenolepis orangiensis]|uniref:ATP-dependent RNA helicase n=1 Tax=Muraenolepis orangiensis TaxID=630683 RepID=A0A9Q0IN65_9TELE|nr:hypothetical protein NHX12_029086 [Muraenolepis orangiensis]